MILRISPSPLLPNPNMHKVGGVIMGFCGNRWSSSYIIQRYTQICHHYNQVVVFLVMYFIKITNKCAHCTYIHCAIGWPAKVRTMYMCWMPVNILHAIDQLVSSQSVWLNGTTVWFLKEPESRMLPISTDYWWVYFSGDHLYSIRSTLQGVCNTHSSSTITSFWIWCHGISLTHNH